MIQESLMFALLGCLFLAGIVAIFNPETALFIALGGIGYCLIRMAPWWWRK